MSDRKISVIIPVYNVENWIEKCVKSIINQTYSCLEIIIVNDGSTDNSESICKEIEKIDERVIIVTQENAGLSAARNTGIKMATGEYITFVDGDDSLTCDIFETIMKKIGNADICAFQYAFVNEDDFDLNRVKRNSNEVRMDSIGALSAFFLDDSLGGVIACSRLYRKKIFQKNNISFPVGRYHEDCFTTYKLFLNANEVIYIPDVGYKYLQRENSITHCNFNDKHLDKLDAADECMVYVKKNRPQCFSAAEYAAIRWYLQVANRVIRSGIKRKQLLYDIQDKIRCTGYKTNRHLSGKYKILANIYLVSITLYSIMLKIFKANDS